jgi:putative ABC transport system permease protein
MLRQDLKHAFRGLRKNPGFATTAIIVLALGIGANTAIFTVVNTVVLKPLPFPNADRLVNIARRGATAASVPMFVYWERNNPGFEDLAAYLPGSNLNLTGGDKPEVVSAMRVSRDYFRLFGAVPIMGRTFTAEEDRPRGAHVLVISFGLWERRFGRSASILGHVISLGGATYTVIGVLSPKFVPYPAAEAWIPLQADPNSTDAAHILQVAAKLPAGTTVAQATARMTTIGKRYKQALAPRLIVGNDDELWVVPLQQQITGDVRPSLAILLGAVGLVLLIACANVANLLLARASRRKKEIAIRVALGASRTRLIGQMLTESLVLALAGGAAGLGLGAWGLRVLLHLIPGVLPRAQEMTASSGLDASVAAFTLLLSVTTGIVFGLIPALEVSRGSLNRSRRNRTRGLLVATEVAVTVVLLAGAVLLIRSFAALHSVSLGFDPRNLLTMEVSLGGPGYASAGAVGRLGRQLVQGAERISGVESAALASALPLFGRQDMIFSIPGRRPLAGYRFTGDVQWRIVSPSYFQVLRIPLISGRLLRDPETARTVVVSQALARKYWPDADPVGQSIVIGAGLGPDYEVGSTEIVGVAGDVRERLDQAPAPILYQTPSQVLDAAMALVNRLDPAALLMRTHAGIAPMSVSEAARQVLFEADLPVSKMRPMEQVRIDSTARQNFNLVLLGLFAAIALVLAATGIYGVMSYSVEQRTQELGIRAALGADRRDILRLVLLDALRMALGGVAVGMMASYWLTRLLTAQLFHVKQNDLVTMSVLPAILTVVALTAAWVPAMRATRVDLQAALRQE